MKVTIKPGCISCGTCELIAPEVFEVEVTAHVRKNCLCAQYREKIQQAVAACPVGVIVIEDEEK